MIPGAYKLSMDEYQADNMTPEPSLSRSGIINLLDSPARAWWENNRLNPNKPPKKNKKEALFDPGSASHDILLEGGNAVFVVEGFEDWKKKEAQEARIAARSCGKIPLLSHQYAESLLMAEAAKRKIGHLQAYTIGDLQTQGDSELTYIWQEKNGVWCRIRPDWLNKSRTICLDYKTTKTSVNPAYVSGHMGKMGYAIQFALYRRGVMAVEGKEPDFIFLFQENEAPYFCSWMDLDMQSIEIAEEKVEVAIKLWGECLASGIWEEYPDFVCSSETKPWDAMEWESKKYQLGGDEE